MDGWKVALMDEQMDHWLANWKDEWMNGQRKRMNKLLYDWMDSRTNG